MPTRIGEVRAAPGSAILVIGLGTLGLGMMVTIAGILAGTLVLPGVILIMIGCAVLAVAGLIQLRTAAPDAPPGETTRPETGRRKS